MRHVGWIGSIPVYEAAGTDDGWYLVTAQGKIALPAAEVEDLMVPTFREALGLESD